MKAVAFKTTDNSIATVVLNPTNDKVKVQIADKQLGKQYERIISPRSIVTFRH